MFDLDHQYQASGYFTGDYEFEELPLDDRAEKNAISAIRDAVAQVHPNGSAFAFYDLHLSEYERHILSQIHIAHDYNVFVSYSKLPSLQNEIAEFFSIALENSYSYASELAYLSTKLVSNIVAISGYNDTEVKIIAYNEAQDDYFPCWHIDKTHEEEITLQDKYNSLQNVFIIALKGPATLYHSIMPEVRKQFNLLANETSHTYGYSSIYNYVPTQGLDKLFSVEDSYFASQAQGSVHLAGYLYGAVHASPKGEERLVIVITPSEDHILNQFKP